MTALRTRVLEVTERDTSIVQMVWSYEGCTTEQIHARFWDPASPLSACYRRVALLVESEYLAAQRLPSITGVGSGKRFLTLGPRGRVLLGERFGVPMGRADVLGTSPLFSQHRIAIGDFRLALERAASAVPHVRLADWVGERQLRRKPLRVEDLSGKGRQTITFVPDGEFTLVQGGRRQRCFFEMDMGTIAPRRLCTRVRGYLLHEATRSLPVFFVVPTESRARQVSEMAQAEAANLNVTPSTVFITTRNRVSPDTILTGPIWEQVGVTGRQAIVPANRRPMDVEAVR